MCQLFVHWIFLDGKVSDTNYVWKITVTDSRNLTNHSDYRKKSCNKEYLFDVNDPRDIWNAGEMTEGIQRLHHWSILYTSLMHLLSRRSTRFSRLRRQVNGPRAAVMSERVVLLLNCDAVPPRAPENRRQVDLAATPRFGSSRVRPRRVWSSGGTETVPSRVCHKISAAGCLELHDNQFVWGGVMLLSFWFFWFFVLFKSGLQLFSLCVLVVSSELLKSPSPDILISKKKRPQVKILICFYFILFYARI